MRCALVLALIVLGGQAAAQSGAPATVRPYLWSSERPKSEVGEVNVFRRFSAERTDAMREFYGDVLGLPVLAETAGGGGRMIRYPVGASEVKLFPVEPSAAAGTGGAARIEDAAGVRLLTFFFADQAALIERFAAHGLPAPGFRPATFPAGATVRALVQDPAGAWVELIVMPGASVEQLARFEIGIAVNDLAASRAFYAELLGLAPRPPVRDDVVGAVKHAFTHGATTINLWSFGAELPRDSETAGMQYIVWNVAAIDAVVRERGAEIDRPLSAPGQMRTLWLRDPDGVSNYFAEFGGNDNRPTASN